jgi:hypothetical protein
MTSAIGEPDLTFGEPAAEHQIQAAATALKGRNVSVHVVDTVSDARALTRDLLPADEEIFTASSQTLEVSGIGADIDGSGGFQSLRTTRLAGSNPGLLRRDALGRRRTW